MSEKIYTQAEYDLAVAEAAADEHAQFTVALAMAVINASHSNRLDDMVRDVDVYVRERFVFLEEQVDALSGK